MNALQRTSLLFFCLIAFIPSIAQDLTGTWEGRLVSGSVSYGDRAPKIVTGTGQGSGGGSAQAGDITGASRESRLVWELVQVKNKLYGIVYFYSHENRIGDAPNSWYTWEGRLPDDSTKPFTFIQGRYVDGLGEMPVYQFNVWHQNDSLHLALKGSWFRSLENLHTLEKPAGYFIVQKTSDMVKDPMWARWKDAKVREKVEHPTFY